MSLKTPNLALGSHHIGYPTYIQLPPQTIQCYCDNSGVITNLMSMKDCIIIQPNDTTNDDYNLYAAITVEAAKCCPLHIHYIHIKGHQDQKNDKPLTTEKAHNVDCDNAAKNYVRQCNLQSTMLGHTARMITISMIWTCQ